MFGAGGWVSSPPPPWQDIIAALSALALLKPRASMIAQISLQAFSYGEANFTKKIPGSRPPIPGFGTRFIPGISRDIPSRDFPSKTLGGQLDECVA